MADEPDPAPKRKPAHDTVQDHPAPPCAKPLPAGGWCTRQDQHQGVCDGPPMKALPWGPDAFVKGMARACSKVTKNGQRFCQRPAGHRGDCD